MTNEKALAKYKELKAEALELIAQIEEGIKNEMQSETQIHWGWTGSMEYNVSELQNISDRIHSEGEYSIENRAR